MGYVVIYILNRAELIWSLPPYAASGLNASVFIFDSRENWNTFVYYLRVMKNNSSNGVDTLIPLIDQ